VERLAPAGEEARILVLANRRLEESEMILLRHAGSIPQVALGCLFVAGVDPVLGCGSEPSKSGEESPVAAEASHERKPDAFARAVERAYVIGFPAVEIERTRRVMTNTAVASQKMAPMNQFARSSRLVTAADREVVTPINDTPYSGAFLDLSAEPLVLHLPEFEDRCFVVPFLSAYHEHFASIGQRSRAANGEQCIAAPEGGDFLIKGPDFAGEPPVGMRVLRIYLPEERVLNGDYELPAIQRVD
jgi:hypothetical protein